MKHLLAIEELVDNSYRQLMFKILLLLIIGFGFLFVILNHQLDGDLHIAIIELMCAVFSLVILLNLKTIVTKNWYKHLVTCYVVIICVLISYVFSANVRSIQLWMLMVPLISYLLLGKKSGFLITLIMLSMSCFVFYMRFGYPLDLVDKKLFINAIGVFSCTWIVAHIYEKATFSAQIKLAKNAATDSLTGLLNRSVLSKVFEKYRHDEFCILLMDIDWFKRINDTYGHEVGDYVLIDFAKLQTDFFIDKGLVFRVGGEEFCVFLPNTNKQHAKNMVDDFIDLVSHRVIEGESFKLQMTFSAGIAYSPVDATTLNELMNIADKNLYQAKNNGRNQVVLQ